MRSPWILGALCVAPILAFTGFFKCPPSCSIKNERQFFGFFKLLNKFIIFWIQTINFESVGKQNTFSKCPVRNCLKLLLGNILSVVKEKNKSATAKVCAARTARPTYWWSIWCFEKKSTRGAVTLRYYHFKNSRNDWSNTHKKTIQNFWLNRKLLTETFLEEFKSRVSVIDDFEKRKNNENNRSSRHFRPTTKNLLLVQESIITSLMTFLKTGSCQWLPLWKTSKYAIKHRETSKIQQFFIFLDNRDFGAKIKLLDFLTQKYSWSKTSWWQNSGCHFWRIISSKTEIHNYY